MLIIFSLSVEELAKFPVPIYLGATFFQGIAQMLGISLGFFKNFVATEWSLYMFLYIWFIYLVA